MPTTTTFNGAGMSLRQKLAVAGEIVCRTCPTCGGSGSGSGGTSLNCAEATDCFLETATTVYGSVEVGGCGVVVQHNGTMVDPDPPQWEWFTRWDATVVGFGSYYEYQDGDAYEGGCTEGHAVNYSVICVDRTDGSSKFAVIAWYTDGVSQWYYYIDVFEAISCDPLYIDTGYVDSVDPSGGPAFRLVLSS